MNDDEWCDIEEVYEPPEWWADAPGPYDYEEDEDEKD